ncbi:MAG: hypothetical protein DMD79_12290 [Candidatus Rokuibacteriota bacterium]|nr:MAG: hypothetical protein DMD79_12290 [Candidatus Rokubacteria bacterium]
MTRGPSGRGLRAAASVRAPRVLDARQARAVALDLLSRKAWARRELSSRLCRRGAPADLAESVVADLEARGYVDDRSFATNWAEARARRLGSLRLRDELTRKGIARPLVEQAVRGAFAEADELTRARQAARRRWPLLQRSTPAQAARRLHDHLARRGYPASVVRQVVRETCRLTAHDLDEVDD